MGNGCRAAVETKFCANVFPMSADGPYIDLERFSDLLVCVIGCRQQQDLRFTSREGAGADVNGLGIAHWLMELRI